MGFEMRYAPPPKSIVAPPRSRTPLSSMVVLLARCSSADMTASKAAEESLLPLGSAPKSTGEIKGFDASTGDTADHADMTRWCRAMEREELVSFGCARLIRFFHSCIDAAAENWTPKPIVNAIIGIILLLFTPRAAQALLKCRTSTQEMFLKQTCGQKKRSFLPFLYDKLQTAQIISAIFFSYIYVAIAILYNPLSFAHI